MDFPGGTVDRNLPGQCRGQEFDPWSGKIPHAPQLSLCMTTSEPACLEPVLCGKRGHCNEKPALPAAGDGVGRVTGADNPLAGEMLNRVQDGGQQKALVPESY